VLVFLSEKYRLLARTVSVLHRVAFAGLFVARLNDSPNTLVAARFGTGAVGSAGHHIGFCFSIIRDELATYFVHPAFDPGSSVNKSVFSVFASYSMRSASPSM
jgi:hypothetical protein